MVIDASETPSNDPDVTERSWIAPPDGKVPLNERLQLIYLPKKSCIQSFSD
ncbi:hypothetical protein GGP52_003075 [Salinibacter ruber]|nr:hypothetical protein [Salinibacter ruber]